MKTAFFSSDFVGIFTSRLFKTYGLKTKNKRGVNNHCIIFSQDDEFVSADQFDFGAGAISPKGPTTRRRSSVQLNKAPLPR